jgi:predicted AlkP superfamily pyrophosphatase or phosphodiesterase
MRFVAWLPALFLLGVGSWGLGGVEAQPASPRLLVVLVADQFRADYVDLFRHRWRGGVRTLLAEGAWFTRAEYPYLNSTTCAGHVTIATGALPRTHGIVLNRWWHRGEQRVYNCTDDEASPHVSYGGAVPFGNSARNVLIPTLADRLRAEQPNARAVAVSLKPRSAIGLAGHGDQIVTWFDEATRTFVTSRVFSPAPVESVRGFIARDSPAADLGKVWALHDDGNTYRGPDLGIGERPKAGWTSLFPHALVGAKGADAQFFDRWQKSPLADAYLVRMALALVDDLQLGRGPSTDYLAIGFSALDLLGHDFGPESREVEDLLIRLDGTLGDLLRRLDERVGRDNYVVALTADHGTAPTPERAGGGHIASEDLQQLVEQTLIGLWGPRPNAPYVAWVGSGSIYFAAGVYDRMRQDPRARQTITRALMDVPGMLRVIRSEEISPASGDPQVRAAAAGYHLERTADILLVPKRHWVIDLRAENEATTHGTFHDYDRRVPILLRGHRIRPGRYNRRVSPADIAPTLALLAGVTLPDAEGRPLRDAIR